MKGNSRTVYVTLSLFFSLASALPWAPGQPVARWQMKWKEEEGQDQRISEAHRKFLTEQVPTMKIIFRDQNFLVINKPYDVRMDGHSGEVGCTDSARGQSERQRRRARRRGGKDHPISSST
mmetsp:Transcript_8259/g.27803  ORF Transcript_8259/g.27803 Transcript_8259/m.27803 type:complete len:121 (-) Transcript_8259:751-1113(-)